MELFQLPELNLTIQVFDSVWMDILGI